MSKEEKRHQKQRPAPAAAVHLSGVALRLPPARADSASSGNGGEGQPPPPQQQQGAAAGTMESKAAAARTRLGHAFVVFQESAATEAALAHNMHEVGGALAGYEFEGRHIRVDRAVAPSRGGREGVVYNPARSLFVGNRHVDIEDEEPAGLLLDGKKLRGRPLRTRVTRPSRSRLPGGAAAEGDKHHGGAVKAAPWQGAVVKGRKGKVVATGGAGGGRFSRDRIRGGGQGEKGERRGGAGGPLGVRKGAGALGKAKGGAARGSKRPAVAARKQRQRSPSEAKGKGY
ncbi:hypothetical protein N2152v2_000614 [Parachlorella kessleri]